ncbi:MAG: hypothetical protein IPM24_21765 [Bryobacterales bacterium]|nr:hypothetical protein [Bryobacterales bacterium]
MRGCRLSLLALSCVLAVPGWSQQTAGGTTAYSYDLNGRRVEDARYTVRDAPTGSQRKELTRTINSRTVPLESSEDKVISQDATSKVVERIVRRYDQNGNPGPPERIRIEERTNADGSKTLTTTSYRGNLSGGSEVAGRTRTHIRKIGNVETKVHEVEQATLNGGLQMVERTQSEERFSGDNSELKETVYRQGVNGRFEPVSSQVSQKTKIGNVKTVDATVFEADLNGRMSLAERTIGKKTERADGSAVEEVEVYSTRFATAAGDVNARQPRLQQQIVRETVPGPDNTTVETTSVRARLVNDPSRFGPYEKIVQTTKVTPTGDSRQTTAQQSTVQRRDLNGNLIVQAATETAITGPAPPPPAPPPAKPQP